MKSPSPLDSTIAAIYEATLEPARFEKALDRIVRLFDASAAAYWTTNRRTSELLSIVDIGHDPEGRMRADYQGYFHSLEPNIGGLLSSPAGAWLADDQAFDPANPTHHEYVYDFAFKYDMGRAAGIKVLEIGDAITVLTLQRPLGAPRFGSQQALLNRLFPHLQRAARISARLNELNAGRRLAFAVLARLRAAICILRTDGEVVFANLRAESMFSGASTVTIRMNRLGAGDTPIGRRLALALSQAGAPRFRASCLRLEMSTDVEAIQMMIVPIGHRSELSTLALGSLVLLVADDPRSSVQDQEILQALWSLTPSEARLLAALAGGEALEAIQRRTGVSMATLRTQLAAIYAKTGAGNQAQAVALARTLPRLATG